MSRKPEPPPPPPPPPPPDWPLSAAERRDEAITRLADKLTVLAELAIADKMGRHD